MTLNSSGDVASAAELSDLVAGLHALALSLDKLTWHGPLRVSADVVISKWLLGGRAVPTLLGTIKNYPTIKGGKTEAMSKLSSRDLKVSLARTFNRCYRLGPDMLQTEAVLK